MSNSIVYPDFSRQGFTVSRRLGLNSYSNRATYLAEYDKNGKKIVIKQFQFGIAENPLESASALKSIEREISALQRLEHPQIPKYLGTFQTHNSYCLVQEYVDAPNLASFSELSPDQIKYIANQVLNILIYTHSIEVKHKDIKPENILVGSNLCAHLIDFGLSVIGTGSLSASGNLSGTLGFISPEQFRLGKVSPSSDLYSLGVTLICLLTKTRTSEVTNKLWKSNSMGQVSFRHLIPKINPRFIEWLEKMVHVESNCRYQNAQDALKALNPLNVYKCPTVSILNPPSIIIADRIGQKITHRLTIKNITSGTLLEGALEIEDHKNDRPQDPWITLSSRSISNNTSTVEITFDTKKLMSGAVFNRNILLRSNAEQYVIPIPIRVRTAFSPTGTKYPPYWNIFALLLLSFLLPIIIPLLSMIKNLSN